MSKTKEVKRVLHFLPNLDVSSGSTTVVMNYYRSIDRERYQFDFLYFDDTPVNYKKEIEKMEGRFFKINKPNFSLTSIKELKTFFSSHKNEWNILHCHPVYAAVALGGIAKKNGIRHIIQHSHSNQFGDTKKSCIRNYVISRLNPLIVSGYFSCSQDASRLLGWKIFWKNKVKILNNAINCERFKFDSEARSEVRKEFGIQEDTVVIGHSGRFSPEKNQLYLLEVFAAYHGRYPNCKLMLLGDGPQKEEIENKIVRLGIEDKVILLGRKENPEKYLCAMDYFVFPSLYEGLSLALVEAQCSGLWCYVADGVNKKTKQIEEYYTFSLKMSPEEVAKLIPCELSKMDRLKPYGLIKKSNLNLKNEAKKLLTYYDELD